MRETAAGVLLAGLLLATFPAAASGLDPLVFQQDMLSRYRSAYPDAKVEASGELSATINLGGEEPITVNFDRIFAFCEAAEPADCDNQKQTFVEAAREIGSVETITLERLRLIVRGTDYLEQIESGFSDGKVQAPIQRPLAEGIGLLLMADFPRTSRTVNDDDLKKLGVTEADALRLAQEQVLAKLPEVPTARELKPGSLLPIEAEYVESLLLKQGAWEKLNSDTGGRLFVFVPGANLLLVGTGSDTDAAAAGEIVRGIFAESPRPISTYQYRWRDGRWQAVTRN